MSRNTILNTSNPQIQIISHDEYIENDKDLNDFTSSSETLRNPQIKK